MTQLLKPLIVETAQKIIHLSPENAQTGPAKRNDSETINTHLIFLSDENVESIKKPLKIERFLNFKILFKSRMKNHNHMLLLHSGFE